MSLAREALQEAFNPKERSMPLPDEASPAIQHDLDTRMTKVETALFHLENWLSSIDKTLKENAARDSSRGRVSWPLVISIIMVGVSVCSVAAVLVVSNDNHLAALIGARFDRTDVQITKIEAAADKREERQIEIIKQIARLEAQNEYQNKDIDRLIEWSHDRSRP